MHFDPVDAYLYAILQWAMSDTMTWEKHRNLWEYLTDKSKIHRHYILAI